MHVQQHKTSKSVISRLAKIKLKISFTTVHRGEINGQFSLLTPVLSDGALGVVIILCTESCSGTPQVHFFSCFTSLHSSVTLYIDDLTVCIFLIQDFRARVFGEYCLLDLAYLMLLGTMYTAKIPNC